jgi:hypothetical protein
MNNEIPEASSQKPEGGDAVAVAQDMELDRVFQTTIGPGLDAQRGRAVAAFAHRMQNSEFRTGNAAVVGRIHRAREVRRLKFWAGAASAMAACLAVVVGLQMWMKPAPLPTRVAAVHPAAPVVDQVEVTRNVDGGTIVWDDEPMRVVRQQTLRKTQWFDPQEKATYSVVEPVEKVGYERLMPY